MAEKGKTIGVSLGDPAGIGAEILVKSFREISKIRYAAPLVIGDLPVIKSNLKFAREPFKLNVVKTSRDLKRGCFNIYSPGIIKSRKFPTGKDFHTTGNASFFYVTEAVGLWQSGLIDALVTLPISKNAWHLAGHSYSGHTELLAEKTGAKSHAMIMVAGRVMVLLATTHIPLKEVSKKLNVRLIVDKVCTGHNFLKFAGIRGRVIGIAALNPHAGESGVLGDEEAEVIVPAVKSLRKMGIQCVGPFPADSIFKKAIDGELDMVVAMYHDQGMIPLKTFYFNKIVNCTAGLGMVRTSPGHGTGFDIAYKGKADPSSFIEAYRTAVRILRNAKTLNTKHQSLNK